MRAVRRSLVVVPAALLSVVAIPAYAGDDSPGLIDTIGKTVDSLVAPKPQAAPKVTAPKGTAPKGTAPKASGPVKQLTTIIDTALAGQTALRETSLVATVDSVLAPQTQPAAPQQVPDQVPADPVAVLATPSTRVVDRIAARPHSHSFGLIELPAATTARPARVVPAASGEEHVPGTSTLPDGGSPLTLTWFVVGLGVTAAGATVIRRARTAN